jgi:hypothetical protein
MRNVARNFSPFVANARNVGTAANARNFLAARAHTTHPWNSNTFHVPELENCTALFVYYSVPYSCTLSSQVSPLSVDSRPRQREVGRMPMRVAANESETRLRTAPDCTWQSGHGTWDATAKALCAAALCSASPPHALPQLVRMASMMASSTSCPGVTCVRHLRPPSPPLLHTMYDMYTYQVYSFIKHRASVGLSSVGANYVLGTIRFT